MSRFSHRVRTRRIRKQSRTLPIRGHKDYGDGEDNGRYYRCWNCGFVCDSERDELGDGESTCGVSHKVYDTQYSGDPATPPTDAMIHGFNEGTIAATTGVIDTLGSPVQDVSFGNILGVGDSVTAGGTEVVALATMASGRTGHVILQNDAAGSPATIRVNWEPDVVSGCPFCGTRNWRGDY